LSPRLIHLRTNMSNTSRFTPLYVVRIFLDILHYSHKNIIIPEALLESDPTIEKNLRNDLQKIDELANSGDSDQIIKFVVETVPMKNKLNDLLSRYSEMHSILFNYVGNDKHIDELDTFMSHVGVSHIINRDVVKDLMPVKIDILSGEYFFHSIFICIFRYILYVKTKHLNLFEQTQINFTPKPTIYCSREMEHTFIFNY